MGEGANNTQSEEKGKEGHEMRIQEGSDAADRGETPKKEVNQLKREGGRSEGEREQMSGLSISKRENEEPIGFTHCANPVYKAYITLSICQLAHTLFVAV